MTSLQYSILSDDKNKWFGEIFTKLHEKGHIQWPQRVQIQHFTPCFNGHNILVEHKRIKYETFK